MNEKIRSSAFFQLRCYALLLARGGAPGALRGGGGGGGGGGAALARRLRLLFEIIRRGRDGRRRQRRRRPRDGGGGGSRSPADYAAMLDATEAEVLATWDEIVALVATNDPRALEHCQRPFCSCHDVRPLVSPTAAGGGGGGAAVDGVDELFAPPAVDF